MTPAQAAEIATLCYGAHPAAAALILEVTNGSDPERRSRSIRALEWLDEMDIEPKLAPIPTTVEGPARAIAFLLVAAVYSPEREERFRIARLLQGLCAEASRLARATRAAA